MRNYDDGKRYIVHNRFHDIWIKFFLIILRLIFENWNVNQLLWDWYGKQEEKLLLLHLGDEILTYREDHSP